MTEKTENPTSPPGMEALDPETTPDYEARNRMAYWRQRAYVRLKSRQPKLLRQLRRAKQLQAWLEDKAESVESLFRHLVEQGVPNFMAEEQAVEAYLDLPVDPEVDEWAREEKKQRKRRNRLAIP